MSAKLRRKVAKLPVRLVLWRPVTDEPVQASFADVRDKWTLRELTEAHILCDLHAEVSKEKQEAMKKKSSRGSL